jgi:hypothetical protein
LRFIHHLSWSRQFSTLINEAQSRNDAKRAVASQQEQTKTSTIFRGFLESSTGFYHNMLAKLRAKYALNLDRSVMSSGSSGHASIQGVIGGRNFVDPKSSTYRHNLTMFRILLRLGDLARYQRDLAGIPDADWQAAWAYYMDAQRLMPDQGMPYNQLAVLCTYSHDTVAALYYYARSLALETPSETGRSNIDVLMRDASFSKYLEAKRKYLEASRTPKKARQIGDGIGMSEKSIASNNASPNLSDLWSVFVSGFFGLHNADSLTSLELVQTNLDAFLGDFEQLVTSDFLTKRSTCVPRPNGAGSSTCMQLIAYNIFAAWSISSQFNEAEVLSNESARLKLARRLNLVVQVSIAMLTFLIEKINISASEWKMSSPGSSPTKLMMDGDSSNKKLSVAATIGRLELLPVVSVFLHWLSTSSSRMVSFDLSSALEATIFSRFQKAIIGLLGMVLPAASQYHAALSTTQGIRRGSPPLPEDTELFPFVPLSLAHNDISFTALSTIHDSDASFTRRCYKIALFALRSSQDVHLVSSTRTPLEDPLQHFASSASVHASSSPHSGIPLFTPTQISEIQAVFAIQSSANSTTNAHPSSSGSDHISGSLHSQELPITSSGFARPAAPATSTSGSRTSAQEDHLRVTSSGADATAASVSYQSNFPSSVAAFEQLADALSSPSSMEQDSVSSSLPMPSSAVGQPPSSPSGSRGAVGRALSESIDDYDGMMAESRKLVSSPIDQRHQQGVHPYQYSSNQQHLSSHSGQVAGGPPRMLFADGFDSEPSLSTNMFTATGVIGTGSPKDSRTSPQLASNSNAMEGVMSFVPGSTSDPAAPASSSYDPWGGSGAHTNMSSSDPANDVAQGGNMPGISSFGSPTIMSDGAPFWNPFLGTSSQVIAPMLPPNADPLASALQGQPRANQDQTRPLLFPGGRGFSSDRP